MIGAGLVLGDQDKRIGRRDEADAAKAQLVRRRFRAFLAGESTPNAHKQHMDRP